LVVLHLNDGYGASSSATATTVCLMVTEGGLGLQAAIALKCGVTVAARRLASADSPGRTANNKARADARHYSDQLDMMCTSDVLDTISTAALKN
jgi:hypothetical protein